MKPRLRSRALRGAAAISVFAEALFGLSGFAIFNFAAVGQITVREPARGTVAPGPNASQAAVRVRPADFVMKRGAVVVLIQCENITRHNLPVTFSNNTRIEPDGTFTRPDGTQGMLREGEFMTVAGVILPPPLGTPPPPASAK